jgi:hypothetical protein
MIIRLPIVALCILGMGTALGARAQTVRLRIEGSDFRDGVPERISFVFVNLSDRSVRIPPLSPCNNRYSGHLTLMLKFSPVQPQTSGSGGGCGGGLYDGPSILEQALTWNVVPPHTSFTVTYRRTELFDNQHASGTYEFFGKYDPPLLTADEVLMLEKAGINFSREALTSEQLRYARP